MTAAERRDAERAPGRLAPGAEPSAGARLAVREIVLLVLLAVLPYVNGLGGDFTYDDKPIIRDNPRLASPAVVGQIFSTHYFGGGLATATAYRPLVLLTYAVQKWIHGTRVVWFHVVNVALHAGVTLALASWLAALGFRRSSCVASAALFAVLTIHVEAVTGLVGRAEVLAALLVFVAARLWLAATSLREEARGETPDPSAGRLRRIPYLGCLAAFTASVFVKENAIVLPGVVLLGELFRCGRLGAFAELASRARRRVVPFLGFLGPVAILFGARRLVLRGFLLSQEAGIFDLENPLVLMKPALRFANAAMLLFRYVAKSAVPVGLSADHSAYALATAPRLSDPRAALALAGLGAGAVLTVLVVRRAPLAAFGSALFFGSFLPTSNLLFPIGTIYAERLIYLPSAGLCAMAIGLLSPVALAVPRPARPWRPALLGVALAAYTAATLARNPVFRDDRSLYADMLVKVPGSAKAHYNFAFDAYRKDDRGAAREQLHEAVRIFDRHYDAWALLGRVEWDEKRWDEAISAFGKSLEIFPHYENGWWGLAKVYEESGRANEAADAYRRGIAEFPDSYPLAYHHAEFLLKGGRPNPAESEWRRAIAVSSGSAHALLGHARALAALGREEEAWNEARRALLAERGLVTARVFLAERYELAGKTLGAAAELSRASRTAPSDAGVAARLLEFGLAHPETRGRVETRLPAIRARFGRGGKDARLVAALLRYPA